MPQFERMHREWCTSHDRSRPDDARFPPCPHATRQSIADMNRLGSGQRSGTPGRAGEARGRPNRKADRTVCAPRRRRSTPPGKLSVSGQASVKMAPEQREQAQEQQHEEWPQPCTTGQQGQGQCGEPFCRTGEFRQQQANQSCSSLSSPSVIGRPSGCISSQVLAQLCAAPAYVRFYGSGWQDRPAPRIQLAARYRFLCVYSPSAVKNASAIQTREKPIRRSLLKGSW